MTTWVLISAIVLLGVFVAWPSDTRSGGDLAAGFGLMFVIIRAAFVLLLTIVGVLLVLLARDWGCIS